LAYSSSKFAGILTKPLLASMLKLSSEVIQNLITQLAAFRVGGIDIMLIILTQYHRGIHCDVMTGA
jgi:hypothetical protein